MSLYVKLDDIQSMPIRLNHYDEKNGDRNFVLGIEMAMKFIDGLPRHEFPDVIECKDCKLNGSFQQCPYSIMTGTIPSDNWFCADAKKR